MQYRHKLQVAFVGSLLVLLVLVNALNAWQVHWSLQNAFKENLQTTAGSLVDNHHNDIITYHLDRIRNVLSLTQEHKNLVFVVFRYEVGSRKEIASTIGLSKSAQESLSALLTLIEADAVYQSKSLDGEQVAIYRHDVVIDDHLWARLYLGGDLTLLNDRLHESKTAFVLIGVLAVVLGLILAYWLSKSLLKPLSQLMLMVPSLGGKGARIDNPIQSNDEIGHLAQSFVTMDGIIKQQMQEQEENNALLYQRNQQLRQESERRLQQSIDLEESRNQLVEAHHDMEKLAYFDILTDLPNRRYFIKILKELIAIPAFQRRAVAVIFVDVNKFKFINDVYGHLVGDQALMTVAKNLAAMINRISPRPTSHNFLQSEYFLTDYKGMVSRFGGDEFVALLTADAAHELQATLIRLEELAAGSEFHTSTDLIVTIELAAGCVIVEAEEEKSEQMLDAATLALHFAKSQRLTGVKLYTPYMKRMHDVKQEFESALLEAITHDDMQFHYQPIANVMTNNIIAVEALLRWPNNPTNINSIESLVEHSEELGMATELARFTVEAVAKQMRKWELDHGLILTVTMNLSPTLLGNATFVGLLQQTLNNYDIAATNLVIEINEAKPWQNTSVVIQQIKRLRELGVRILMDDFGTGYSSLAYLADFPLDGIKVDKSLSSALIMDDARRHIAEMAIQLGKEIGLTVIMEGVENAQQLACLRELNCNFYQGYFLSHALPASDIPSFIKNWQRRNRQHRDNYPASSNEY